MGVGWEKTMKTNLHPVLSYQIKCQQSVKRREDKMLNPEAALVPVTSTMGWGMDLEDVRNAIALWCIPRKVDYLGGIPYSLR